MFVPDFLWDDDGRSRLTTWSLYILQIHHLLVHINSPIYWHVLLEHLLCVIHRDNATSLLLGCQLIYFLPFLLLNKSIFLCFESRYVFNYKLHDTIFSLQWLNKQGICFNHLTGSPAVDRPGVLQLLKNVNMIPDSLLLQHLTLVLMVTSLLLHHQALHPCSTQAEAGRTDTCLLILKGSYSPRTFTCIILSRTWSHGHQ